HVLVPRPQPPSGFDANQPRFFHRTTARFRNQAMTRLVRRHVATAEYDAIADSMLDRDVPTPARRVGITGRIGLRVGIDDRLEGDGAVARQIVRPIFIASLQRAFDEQRTKAGAVDEEIAFDDSTVFELERFD